MLYYGDEIGMWGENDPDCRRCMVWDKERWNDSIACRSRQLIKLRHELPALRSGSWEPLFLFNGICAYRRRFEGSDAVVVLNPRDAQHDLAIPTGDSQITCWRDVLGAKTNQARDGMLLVEDLPACSALVLVPGGSNSR
jgi:glycosidase